MVATHPNILVVDKEPGFAQRVRRTLGPQGFTVSVAGTGPDFLEALGAGDVDLVLFGLGLDDRDGLPLLAEARTLWSGPVIVASTRVDSRQLLAHARAHLRSTGRSTRAPDEAQSEFGMLSFEGFHFDVPARCLVDISGEEKPLTTGEFKLLHTLLEHANEILSRNFLMNAMHHRDNGPFDRAIDLQICRLRRKIEANPAKPRLIKSVRGEGYVFTARVDRW